MKLSHKNRARHDAGVARRRALRDPLTKRAESNFARLQRLFGRKGTVVRICKGDGVKVPSRYQGTKATVISIPRPDGILGDSKLFGLPVKVKAYRRKAPMLVRLEDLDYPVDGKIEDTFASGSDAQAMARMDRIAV